MSDKIQSIQEKKETANESKPLSPNDLLKYEIAGELGLLDKIKKFGWKSLTAKESGKIGGLMTKRNREKKSFDTIE